MKAGYKHTEVGLIPEDWGAKSLSDVATVVRGGSPRPAGDPRYFNGDFIPWLTVAALTSISDSMLYVTETVGCLTEEGSRHSRTLEKETLIISNSGATLGVAKILGIRCCANDGIAALINQSAGNKRFICYYLNTRTKYLRDVVATGNGQPNLNTELIGNISIPFPTPDEQQAIAEALSDVDALIGTLDKLIAKKRDLKQATMQRLLTGKQRLPGFSGDWEVKRLGEIGSTFGGLTGKTKSDFGYGAAHYITFMNIMTNVVIDPDMFEHVKVSPSESQNRVMKGDLFFNGSSETPEEVGMCAVLLQDVENVFLNSFCFGFRLREGAESDGRYLAYYFRSSEGRKLLFSLAQGPIRYNLAKTSLLKLTFPLPPFIEQAAIAAVLSDMDAEIAALEQRRTKTRALKQGMMQELLTGKTRLI